MPSERMQRRIDAFLDQAEDASERGDWTTVRDLVARVRAIDPANDDAAAFLAMADAAPAPAPRQTAVSLDQPARSVLEAASIVADLESRQAPDNPESFAGGRYRVLRFLGEGGKKRVFLAHDVLLDRDVAFSLIKTDGLDAAGRERIMREARAMGRLTHHHIVAIYDIGEHTAADGTRQPYLVQELMGGGDVEGLLEDAAGPLPLQQALDIAIATARGLDFAHAQGIVHRDLKPGNVWLTADGTAKIGDLGLAITLGQTRLTAHGMMVGTYHYMPPEQALGHEVTAQADLYSLGAMLYELVTGRPPFQGDTPTAVISQHINTPPVAPSWYSDHCPPDLEVLILRLLAKVPADRPASAAEVLTALEAVDPEARSVSHSDSSANPLDRLARGVFVGRARELERLRAAFDEAFAGRGSVVMLVGEPGIGKTRTSLELETYARMRGGRVIWGRAHEAAGAPPYRPWVQAADTYSSLWGLEGIIPQLAAEDTAELSRIFTGLRQQAGYVPPPEIVDPSAAQFRLFEAYTKLLRAFASEAPLVVVLDDLHWSDKPTLLLLQHVARELGRLRVLIVGTYRDTELSRTHPLSEALAELNREGGFQRINLGGLARDEVANYIRGTAGVEPSRALVERVYEETEGNPFFLAEVVNLMTEEGTISSDSVSDIAIPEGVREALGRRLDRLSEEANALLQYAAVAGRQFAYDTLKLLTEHDDDALLRLIEEGLAARVIEETAQPGRYQFTHALMQETLLDELSTTRRVRMHGQIADVLEERYGDRADEQAARLATHYLESSTLNANHVRKALEYAIEAARQAEAAAAWGEAARQWGIAIDLADERGVGTATEIADMLVAFGRVSRIAGGDVRAGWRSLLRARDLYRSAERADGLAQATLELSDYLGPPERKTPLLEEALEALGEARPDLRANLLTTLLLNLVGPMGTLPRDFDDSESTLVDKLFAEAENLVAETGAPAARARLMAARAYKAMYAGDAHCVELFREAEHAYSEAGFMELASFAPMQQGLFWRSTGNVDRWAEAFERGERLARENGATTALRGYLWQLGEISLLRGDWIDVERRLSDMERLPGDKTFERWLRASLLELRGELGSALSELREVNLDPRPSMVAATAARRAELSLLAGDRPGAQREFERWAGLTWAPVLGTALTELGAPDLLQRAYNATRPASSFQQEGIPYPFVAADRVLGSVALRLDLIDAAEQHFATGLEWCERERCPIEAGRCRQGLAEVAERRDNHALAMQHLDAAGDLFSRHGAKLYLDQVLAKKEILKA